MKKILPAIALVFLFLFASAQVKMATKDDLERFQQSTTLVVLEGDPFSAFNDFVSNRFKEVWTVTPFEVITTDEFEERCGDANSSFLLVAEARFDQTRSALFRSKTDILTDYDTYTYDILTLVMGDPSKKIDRMPDLASVPLAYTAVGDNETYEYKLGAVIYFMQFYVKYCYDNQGKDIRNLVKENAGRIKEYELWLRAEDLAPEVNSETSIRKVYPYPVRITTREEIEQAIRDKNPKVALLHKIGPEGSVSGTLKCWKFIVTAAEGNPLYFESHKIGPKKPDAFLEEDFSKLSK